MRSLRVSKRIDPAPSKISYFMQRLWLKRNFKPSLGSFLVILLLCLAFYVLEKKINFSGQLQKMSDLISNFMDSSPALKINGLNVISNDSNAITKITNKIGLDFPVSSLDINVEELRIDIESISFIKSASVRIKSEGFIEIKFVSRNAVIIHRDRGKYVLLDIEGQEVDKLVSREDRNDLPLIIGSGAENSVREALMILIEAEDLAERIRGLIRIGDRRWNIALNRGQTILLPENDSLVAIKKILLLHQGQRILDRGVSYLDFRDISRPIVGLTDQSLHLLRESRALIEGNDA